MDDSIVIRGKFTRNLLAKILKKLIKKKTGLDIDIEICSLEAQSTEFGYLIKTSAEARVTTDQFSTIFKLI